MTTVLICGYSFVYSLLNRIDLSVFLLAYMQLDMVIMAFMENIAKKVKDACMVY